MTLGKLIKITVVLENHHLITKIILCCLLAPTYITLGIFAALWIPLALFTALLVQWVINIEKRLRRTT